MNNNVKHKKNNSFQKLKKFNTIMLYTMQWTMSTKKHTAHLVTGHEAEHTAPTTHLFLQHIIITTTHEKNKKQLLIINTQHKLHNLPLPHHLNVNTHTPQHAHTQPPTSWSGHQKKRRCHSLSELSPKELA